MIKMLVLPPRRARHQWSDWAGFIFFAWLASAIFRRSPMLAVMMLPVFLHDLATGIAFLVRRPAKARLAGWGPRIAAYGGTLLMPAFLVFAGSRRPSWVRLTPVAWTVNLGYCVWLAGIGLAIWTVWRLRHSFSLEPQARELVRSGPYRIARHPIYAAYVLQYIGMWLAHFTLPFGIAFLAWLALVAARVHYEEMVLEGAFPEYAEYRRQVGLLGPRLFPAGTARKQSSQLQPGTLRVSGALSSPASDWRIR